MAKVLFFFTNDYPFGKDETFIENEMPILANAFNKIVVISNDCTSKQTRKVPENVVIERYSYFLNTFDQLLSLFGVFSKSFWVEMKIIKTIYHKKRSKVIVKTALQSLRKSAVFNKRIKRIIAKYSDTNDELFAYSYWADDTAYALTKLKKSNPNIKTFCRAHRWDIYFEENKSNYLPFRLALLENLDAFFVISENGKKYIETLFAKTFPTVQIARLGVNRHIRSPYPESVFTLVSISNIIPVKNLKTLVEALALLEFDFMWYHIGDGPQRQETEQLAKEKINGKFHFLGSLPNNDVLSFLEYTPISLFVNVSLSEGVPVSIMEALSCGIPVLATDVGGNREIVSNENGMLIPADANDRIIADALTKFKNTSTNEMIKLRIKAYNCWNKKFNAETNYLHFVHLCYTKTYGL